VGERKRIVLRRRAVKEIDDIRIYLEKQRPSSAAHFGQRLNESWELLARMPLLGRLARAPRMLRKGFRAFVIDEYIAYYKVKEDGVEVYHVVHAARRVEGAG
jgi:toxin ParE1/3/4